jgi:lysophospholipase L1-like esterase
MDDPETERATVEEGMNSGGVRVGLLLAIVISAAAACHEKGGDSPTGPGPIPQPSSTITYVAIGASDAIAIGSSAPCLPFVDCPQGRGYVQVAARELKARGFTVNLTNLGVPATVLSRRIQDLAGQYGRTILGNFLEQQAPFVPPAATFVTIFAGANDVDSIVAALGGGAGGSDQVGYINSQIQAFGQDFSTLLGAVRDKAPTARIAVLNLPNMAGMPRHANASLQQRRAEQMLSVGITTQVINAQAASGVLVVDMMCDPRSYEASTYSSDGFHPSDAGYAWMAAEVVAASTTAYKPPASGCSQMTIVN